MKILIRLKESCKHKKITCSVGTFRKGVIHAIDPKYFDSSIMEKVKEDAEKVVEPVTEDSVPEEAKTEEIPKVKVYSKSELYAMNKSEQTEILKGFNHTAPSKEKDRVELILKLQA